MQAVQRDEREKRIDGGKRIGGRSPYFCRKAEKAAPPRGAIAPYGAAFMLFGTLPVFNTTSPGEGSGLNCAGAHHGSLTPPRISRSCVQDYHCGLTGSWRGSLPMLP